MTQDARKTLMNLYDKLVLSPELGDGNLKKRLLTGLEDVLDQVHIGEPNKNKQYTDEPINFEKMHGGRYYKSGAITRLKNVFSEANIATYKDLARAYLNWKKDTNDYGYEQFIKSFHKLGKDSWRELKSHLDEIGFETTEDYAKLITQDKA